MDSFGILYQGTPSNSDTVIYTVPERAATSYTVGGNPADIIPSVVDQNIQTMVTQMILCDAVGGGDTIDVHLVENSSDAAAAGNMAFNALTIATTTTERLKLNWTLSAGETIRVVPTTGSRITITLLGIEVK